MKILSFDVESNGLHGKAFAVAAVLVHEDGSVEDEFLARCPIEGPLDPWVQANVLPPMRDIAETHCDARAMRNDFWRWYIEAKVAADFVLSNNPYPVEARFLIACQEDDPVQRFQDHPFPLIDLASMLYAASIRTRQQREEFMREVTRGLGDNAHNPRWDAHVTALGALKVLGPQSSH